MSPLSVKAQELIDDCVRANDVLMFLPAIGGTTVQVGGKSALYDGMRERREVEAAVQELVRGRYIADRAGKGEIFFPTPKAYGIDVVDDATERIAKTIIQKAVAEEQYINVDLFRGVGLRVGVGDGHWGSESPKEAIQCEVAFLWLMAHDYVERRGARGDFYEPTHLAFTTFGG